MAVANRRWVTCETRRGAEDVLSLKLKQARQPIGSSSIDRTTLAKLAVQWLEIVGQSAKARTVQSYRHNLYVHILPALGRFRLDRLRKGAIRDFLIEKLRAGLSRNTVRLIHAKLRAM